MRKASLLADLLESLSELKIDANGGDPVAREKIQAIYDLLDDAIEGHLLQAPDLMMTGKILSDAGWVIPDSLKQATAEALQASPPEMEEGGTPSRPRSVLARSSRSGRAKSV